MEFSKKLLFAEYIILVGLILAAVNVPTVDFSAVICAWIGLMGISHGMYYWKAKNENRVKVPMRILKAFPAEMKKNIDLTQVIVAIIQSE